MSTATLESQIQYISDAEGKEVGVVVPIELWREIASERETAYLLQSAAMRKRLLDAINRDKRNDIPFEEACEKLGIRADGV